MNTKILVRLPEAAAILSMSERALWARAQRDEIPSFTIGRSRFFSVVALRDWVDSKFNNRGEK